MLLLLYVGQTRFPEPGELPRFFIGREGELHLHRSIQLLAVMVMDLPTVPWILAIVDSSSLINLLISQDGGLIQLASADP